MNIGLPRTGQTTNRRAGDDSTFQAGARPYATRSAELIDLGNGTVHDRATGLQWVKQPELIIPGAVGIHAANQIQAARGNWANSTAYAKADLAKDTVASTYWVCSVAHTSGDAPATFAEDRAANPTYWRQSVWTDSAANLTTPGTFTWADSVDVCLALEYAGFSDWRLPNIHELRSLVNFVRTGPAAFTTSFPNTKSGYYWCSTGRADSASYNWFVEFSAGASNNNNAVGTPYYARPVRGGRTL